MLVHEWGLYGRHARPELHLAWRAVLRVQGLKPYEKAANKWITKALGKELEMVWQVCVIGGCRT